jgi:hypothetical protein
MGKHSSNIYGFQDLAIPYWFYPNLPFVFRAVLFRTKINMNTFLLVVGNPRTSKSFFAMKFAEVYLRRVGKKFDVETQLCFDDIKKFLMWSQNAEDSLFILDETGTTLSPDLFWSLQQRIMRRFVQTQGFRKNVLIWVLPSIIFIQKGFRFLSNYGIKTIRQGLVEIHKIKVDQLIGKGYPQRIETLSFGMPSKETLDKYTEMKRIWNDQRLKEDIDFLKMTEEESRPFNKQEILSLLCSGLITEETAKSEMGKIGYNEERTNLLLNMKAIKSEISNNNNNRIDENENNWITKPITKPQSSL